MYADVVAVHVASALDLCNFINFTTHNNFIVVLNEHNERNYTKNNHLNDTLSFRIRFVGLLLNYIIFSYKQMRLQILVTAHLQLSVNMI
jgi:hypothetical protein